VKVPELAESITEGTIAEWLKKVGDTVEKGEAILELETDKVNVEVVSEEAGTLQELLAEEGDTVEVGQAIAVVGEGSGNASSEQSTSSDDDSKKSEETASKEQQDNQSKDQPTQKEETSSNDRINATPSARRAAREKGVSLNEVQSIVRKEDVERGQQAKSASSNTSSSNQDTKPQKSATPSKPVIR
ncbi:dihydrolipoamide succinyltransferase, partial [Staphylococcus equorum]